MSDDIRRFCSQCERELPCHCSLNQIDIEVCWGDGHEEVVRAIVSGVLQDLTRRLLNAGITQPAVLSWMAQSREVRRYRDGRLGPDRDSR